MQLRAVARGAIQVTRHRFFGADETGSLLVKGDGFRGWIESRKAAAKLACVQDFVRETVLCGAPGAARNQLALPASDQERASNSINFLPDSVSSSSQSL
jgi:hypothetical protein